MNDTTSQEGAELKVTDLKIDSYSSACAPSYGRSVDRCVRVTHIPTGLTVTACNERSDYKNKAAAIEELKIKLAEHNAETRIMLRCPFCGCKPNIGGRMLARDGKTAADQVTHPATGKCALDMLIFRIDDWQQRAND